MTKKDNKKIFFRCLATVLLLVLVLGYLSSVFERKDSRDNLQEFFEQQENFDVLLLGTSHIFNGVSPMDMWEQNGIVAYNLGAPGCRIATTYWILRNALEYTQPKVVVLDCAYLLVDKAHANTGYMHTILDGMPLNRTKIEALMDLYDQKEDILRFLFPFSLYHSRWNDLSSRDFFYQPVYGKMGLSASCEVVNAELPDFSVAEVKPVDNPSTEYLLKIIELCRQQDIEVLLTFLPFNMGEESKNDAAYVRMLAQQQGIDYLGPEELLHPIDPATDFMNNDEDNSHLNLSGAHKMSYFLGDYLSQNYSVPDQRQNPNYADWHHYYSLYEDYKLSLLTGRYYLENYLVAMADQNYRSVVYIHDKACLQNEMVANLLMNLGMESSKEEQTEKILFAQVPMALEVQIAEGYPALVRDNEILHQWNVPVTDGGVYILVMDDSSGEILDAAVFSSATRERLY